MNLDINGMYIKYDAYKIQIQINVIFYYIQKSHSLSRIC